MRVFQNYEFRGENEGNHRLGKAQSYKRIPNYFFCTLMLLEVFLQPSDEGARQVQKYRSTLPLKTIKSLQEIYYRTF